MPRLGIEFGLLTFDPTHARDNGKADGFVAEANRGSDPHTPIRRVDAKMEVLDRLSDHIDMKPADCDLMAVLKEHAKFVRQQEQHIGVDGLSKKSRSLILVDDCRDTFHHACFVPKNRSAAAA